MIIIKMGLHNRQAAASIRLGGEGDPSEPALDLGSSARKLGQIFRSLICLTAHMRADPSTRLIVVETHLFYFNS